MKNSHITKNRMRVALLLALAASIIGLAPAFSTSARAGSGSYSINDVSGNYVELGERWDCLGDCSGKQFIPGSVVGLATFTPATGTWHANFIARLAGVNHSASFDGTYTVDADGHGTMTFIGAFPKHIDFYIVNGGAELKWINTDPPGSFTASVTGTLTKQ